MQATRPRFDNHPLTFFDMGPPRRQPPDSEALRAVARERLRDAASTGCSTVLGVDAMGALMRLALHPDHAEDALALQQELQIHQIEIEVLAESLEQTRQASVGSNP